MIGEIANFNQIKRQLKMNKQTTTTIMTRLRWGAFFLVLLFLGFQVIPRAIGQRDASKRSSDVEIPFLKQQPPPLEPAVCSSWAATGSLNTGRYFHTATLLPNGMMLVAGGFSTGGASTSAELYDPASGSWTATGSLNTARYAHGDLAAQRNGAGCRGAW